jgi:hypothetical protein
LIAIAVMREGREGMELVLDEVGSLTGASV